MSLAKPRLLAVAGKREPTALEQERRRFRRATRHLRDAGRNPLRFAAAIKLSERRP
jgi:hypothetical protein